mgnify:CR=1 FL=1
MEKEKKDNVASNQKLKEIIIDELDLPSRVINALLRENIETIDDLVKVGKENLIDVKGLEQTGRVVFGVTVTIENLDTEEKKTYKIVGDDEADFKINKISVNSPIARGLLGKNEGDEAKITTPQGEVEYEVVSVEYI